MCNLDLLDNSKVLKRVILTITKICWEDNVENFLEHLVASTWIAHYYGFESFIARVFGHSLGHKNSKTFFKWL